MSKKISGERLVLPEVAKRLIQIEKEKKQRAVDGTKKEANDTIAAYAAVLGWYTAEDGVVDIEKSKLGLITLVKECDKYFLLGCIGNGRVNEDGLRKHKLTSDDEVAYIGSIAEAYSLLSETFEDFNKFVEELWAEYEKEFAIDHRKMVEVWQEKKGAADKVQADAEKRIDAIVEAELKALQEIEDGKGKKKIPARRVREIEKQIFAEVGPDFAEEKPVYKGMNREVKKGKTSFSINEVENNLSKLEK